MVICFRQGYFERDNNHHYYKTDFHPIVMWSLVASALLDSQEDSKEYF